MFDTPKTNETAGAVEEGHSSALSKKDPNINHTASLPHTLVDLNYAYETGSGRLVVDPVEAAAEFGKDLANQLKLDETGTIVLWPQPSDDPHDPQNWSKAKKMSTLIVLAMAAFVPDFDSAIGIASLFYLAEEYHTTPGVINDKTSNWSIFMLGPGGILAVILAKRYGRLPVLFWSQVLGLGFLIGCVFAQSLNVFAAMRCLNAFFSAAPQIMGLYCINDMYPFHLQARMLNFWTCGFLVSPFVSPWLFGYLVARADYRWAYGIGCIYSFIVVILIALIIEETCYDRFSPFTYQTAHGFRSKVESLIGITGCKMAKFRCSWKQATLPLIGLLVRPQCLAILIYLGVVFGFGIGINVTNVVFTTSPRPLGYGLSQYAVASLYATPVVAVVIGEIVGRHLNDRTVSLLTKRNYGVFEPEMRLWTLYAAIPLVVAGFIVLGGAFQYKWNLSAVVFGWGMAQIGIMVTTVACYNYLNNAFFLPGEVSAVLNQARTLGGFAVPYFQVEWAQKNGALQTFGCEAAITAGLFLLIVPMLQIKGESFRTKYGLKPHSMSYVTNAQTQADIKEHGEISAKQASEEKTPT